MDWEQWNECGCNILTNSIDNCKICEFFHECLEYQSLYSQVPNFIVDQIQPNISSPAFKIFIYLNRLADFNKRSNNHGKCWTTYEKIESVTHISKSNMRKYIRELVDFGLIDHHYKVVVNDENKYSTTHTFTIKWRSKLAKLKALKG